MARTPKTKMTAADWLARLVGFDTTSAKSNLPLIEDVAGHLDDLGAAVRLIHDADGGKANLFATIGPSARAASCCRATATSCRSPASRGTPTRSWSANATAASMAAARRT